MKFKKNGNRKISEFDLMVGKGKNANFFNIRGRLQIHRKNWNCHQTFVSIVIKQYLFNFKCIELFGIQTEVNDYFWVNFRLYSRHKRHFRTKYCYKKKKRYSDNLKTLINRFQWPTKVSKGIIFLRSTICGFPLTLCDFVSH